MKTEQADGKGLGIRARSDLKRQTRRRERRKAKQDPEKGNGYKQYRGHLT